MYETDLLKPLLKMESLPQLLENLHQESSDTSVEKSVDQLIDVIGHCYADGDGDDAVPKAVVQSAAFSRLTAVLSVTQEQTTLTTKVAQLIAELAKTEAVRVPMVHLGVVPPLLALLQSNSTAALVTQVCRALGNICFDNDTGRQAVDVGDGLSLCIQLIQRYTKVQEEGAAKVRVLACGFILNLTNECDWLQDKAVECGALTALQACLTEHAEEEDLYNMAIAAFLRIADCDATRSPERLGCVVETLVWVVSRDHTASPLLPVLEELNLISQNEEIKVPLAESSLPAHLIHIIANNTAFTADEDRPDECTKVASDLLLSLLVGDGSMEKLYGGGEGQVFKQCVQWLDADVDNLRVLGALAIGNFARNDAHCRQLVDSGIVESLLSALKTSSSSTDDISITLQHAVLSSLRNLAIPASNKGRLLELGVMTAVLSLKHTEVMAVTFKLLGVLRMLIDGQEMAATFLGQDRDFLTCLVDWCGVDEHAGVKGEATRLMAWMIKNSKMPQVMRNLVLAEGVQHLVIMATSEHLVMQNEAVVALNLMAATVLCEAAVSLKEAGLSAVLLKILTTDDTAPELLCNTLTLLRTLAAAVSPSTSPSLPCSLLACARLRPDTLNSLRQDLVTFGLCEAVRRLNSQHAQQAVREAAASALAALEDEMNR